MGHVSVENLCIPHEEMRSVDEFGLFSSKVSCPFFRPLSFKEKMFRRNLWRLGVTTAQVEAKLRNSELLKPTAVVVEDISGGCGSFFKVSVTSAVFEGKMLVQQHRLVNDVLKEEIAELHGLTIITKKP